MVSTKSLECGPTQLKNHLVLFIFLLGTEMFMWCHSICPLEQFGLIGCASTEAPSGNSIYPYPYPLIAVNKLVLTSEIYWRKFSKLKQ